MTLIAKPSNYQQKLGDANSPVSVTIVTDSLTGATLVCEAVGGTFNDQNYTIEVSDHDGDYITLRSVGLGQSNITSNSFTTDNVGVFGNQLHFKYNKYTIPALGSGIKGRITFSGR